MTDNLEYLKAFCWLMDAPADQHDMAVKMIRLMHKCGIDLKSCTVTVYRILTAPKQ